MKVAVVGSGAVGSYYGAKMSQAGHEVHFLLRSDYDAVKRSGVEVRSIEGDFRAYPQCARLPEEIGPSDLVLVGLKTTANDQFPKLIPPLVSAHTAVVTLQNGLGNEEDLERLLPADQILGGLCFVCLNRVEPGVILHLDFGQIVLGEYRRAPGERLETLAAQLRQAGILCKTTDNLDRAHWEKLVWNIPFNGLGVAAVAGFEAQETGTVEAGKPLGPCLTTDQLLADARWEGRVRELMLEVIRVGRALGYDLSDALAEIQISRTRKMGSYKASTLIDFERGLPMELTSLFLEPLNRAKRTGVATPCLERLCGVLAQIVAGSYPGVSPT